MLYFLNTAHCGYCQGARCGGVLDPDACTADTEQYRALGTEDVRSELKDVAADPDADFTCDGEPTPAEVWAAAAFDAQADVLEILGLDIHGMPLPDAMDLVNEALTSATPAQWASCAEALNIGAGVGGAA